MCAVHLLPFSRPVHVVEQHRQVGVWGDQTCVAARSLVWHEGAVSQRQVHLVAVIPAKGPLPASCLLQTNAPKEPGQDDPLFEVCRVGRAGMMRQVLTHEGFDSCHYESAHAKCTSSNPCSDAAQPKLQGVLHALLAREGPDWGAWPAAQCARCEWVCRVCELPRLPCSQSRR